MTNEELWKTVLKEMEARVSRTHFVTWVKASRLIDRTPESVSVGLPNTFSKQWFEEKYHKDILGIVRNVDPGVKKVEFAVSHATEAVAMQATFPKKAANLIQLDFKVDPVTGLNPRYTLESFIVGSSNELAHAAAAAVVDQVGTKYNPLFIYGGVGLGKTHLIQAIGNEVRNKQKALRPQYVTSEKFTSDVIWATRNQRMQDLHKKYRDIDLLIIDDIQFIGGKEKTQEYFFHAFNSLYENNKQIIISSDRPPQAIATLEERLRSRFEGGLIADISLPDYETRVAIIRSKLAEKNQRLGDDVMDVVAKKIKKNVRELEGVLTKLTFYQESHGEEVTVKVADGIIEKTLRSLSKPVSESQIMQAIGEYYNVQPSDLTGRSRRREVVEPRQIAMYLLRDILNLSYPYIGIKLGRDHTTAIHAFEKITQEVNKNSGLNQKIFQIKELLTKT